MTILRLYLDSPVRWGIDFQDPATGIMEEMIRLHHLSCNFLAITLLFILYFLYRMSQLFDRTKLSARERSRITEFEMIAAETVWTAVPCCIIAFLGLNSFTFINTMDEIRNDYGLTVKAIAHQWYWTYEYRFKSHQFAFDSRLLPEEYLTYGAYRLLEVDIPMTVPVMVPVRLLVTSDDVVHSWAVPSLGIKLDATPGRINATGFVAKREGTFFGQCSEICGINHAFMPIMVEAVTYDRFVKWVDLMSGNLFVQEKGAKRVASDHLDLDPDMLIDFAGIRSKTLFVGDAEEMAIIKV